MKKLISTLVIAAAISSPVFAEKGHEHGDSKDQPMGGMMMGHEQMMAMHEHMQNRSGKTPATDAGTYASHAEGYAING